MKKSLLLLSLTALVASGLEARTLSPAEALQRALGSSSASVSRSGQPTVQSTPVMTVGEAQAPAAYVFAQDREGFLIISADDVAAPLLGYSESGTFDPDNIPDNLRWWLGEYAAQIQAANAAGASVYDGGMQSVRTPIAPLLKTTWDQGAPYNDDCPVYRNQRTVTGCVATAMAQVMNYHQWPEKCTERASFSYKWNGQILSASFINQPFDWDNMLDSYSGEYTDAQAVAVAYLMKACGYSVEMSYNISANGGSGASSQSVGGALIKAFQYSPDLENAPRSIYTTTQWEDLIYKELSENRPVLYGGSGSGGGHCFVCDGYSGKGYFHFNWGWSGISDGYFLLNALDPDNLGIGGGTGGYNSGQMALIGVKPATTASTNYPMKFVIDGLLSAAVVGENLVISGDFSSYSTVSAAPGSTLNLEVKNSTGTNSYGTITVGAGGMKPGSYYPSLPITLSTFANLPDGTYRIYFSFTNGNKTYPFLYSPAQRDYVEFIKSGNSYTVTAPSLNAYSIVNQKLESEFYINSSFYVSGASHYTGAVESRIPVYGVLLSGTTASTIVGVGDELNQIFSPDSDEPVEYFSSWFTNPDNSNYSAFVSAGDYYFAMATKSAEGYTLLSTPVKVKVNAESATVLTVTNWNIENANSVDPDNMVVNVDLQCVSGYLAGNIEACLFSPISGYSVTYLLSDVIFLGAGESKSIVIKGPLTGVEKGVTYPVMLYYGDTNLLDWSKCIDVTIGDRSGISDVIADGAGKITASPNPAEDYTVISASADIVRVDLVSVGGLMTGVPVELDGTTARLDVSRLSSGLYVARVVTATGVEAVKIVKK